MWWIPHNFIITGVKCADEKAAPSCCWWRCERPEINYRLQTHHLPSVLNHRETEHIAQSAAAAAVILTARRGIILIWLFFLTAKPEPHARQKAPQPACPPPPVRFAEFAPSAPLAHAASIPETG